jgi:hypothetical protein
MDIPREELQQRIQGYQEQARAIDEVLMSDPLNAQFLKLKDDLQKVINLTTELLLLKDAPSSSSISSNVRGERSGGNDDDPSDNDDSDAEGEEITAFSLASRPPVLTGSITVGETVEVLGGDRPYAGVVTALEDPSTFRIKYFEYETEVSLPTSSVVRIPPGPFAAEDVKPGLRCQSKYSADQTYYNAVVTAATARGFSVKVDQNSNEAELKEFFVVFNPYLYLRTFQLVCMACQFHSV